VSTAEVVQRHAAMTHAVAFAGFPPGFAYIAGLPDRLRGVPRRNRPRTRVPAGSVAVADQFTGIYPRVSVSAFHRNFQAVTAMTPIQFQKHIRLQAARLLLANRPNDITGVGHRVDSPAQFSRQYRRQFGAPPSIDAVRMRGGAGPAAAALP
jgi:hypothetical protein